MATGEGRPKRPVELDGPYVRLHCTNLDDEEEWADEETDVGLPRGVTINDLSAVWHRILLTTKRRRLEKKDGWILLTKSAEKRFCRVKTWAHARKIIDELSTRVHLSVENRGEKLAIRADNYLKKQGWTPDNVRSDVASLSLTPTLSPSLALTEAPKDLKDQAPETPKTEPPQTDPDGAIIDQRSPAEMAALIRAATPDVSKRRVERRGSPPATIDASKRTLDERAQRVKAEFNEYLAKNGNGSTPGIERLDSLPRDAKGSGA